MESALENRPRDRRDRLLVGLFVLGVVGVATWWMMVTDHWMLAFEDFRLIAQGSTFRGLFRPYNEHLSVVPLAVYQGMVRLFGTSDATGLRAVSIGTQLGVAVSLFVVVRRRVGAELALIAGAAMVFFPNADIVISAFNHYLAFIAVVVCAWILAERPNRGHLALVVVLGFALCSSSVAIAGAVGCVVFLVATRPSWRRWLAVLVPIAGWVMWRQVASDSLVTSSDRPGVSKFFSQTVHGMWWSFKDLAFGNRWLGVVLVVAFVANLAWQLRHGLRNAAHELSWTVAALSWWAGLSLSAKVYFNGVFRYQYIGAGFLVLAMLPTVPKTLTIFSTARARMFAGPAAVVAAVAFALASIGGINAQFRFEDSANLVNERMAVYTQMGPRVMPDLSGANSAYILVPPGTFRELFTRYGVPEQAQTSDPDGWLIAKGEFHVWKGPRRTTDKCTAAPAVQAMRGPEILGVGAGPTPVTIQARLMSRRWTTITVVPAHGSLWLGLQEALIERPWQVRTVGACILD